MTTQPPRLPDIQGDILAQVASLQARQEELEAKIRQQEKEMALLKAAAQDLEKSEQNLQQAKEYAEKLIETANVIVVGLDSQGKVQVFNQAAEQITGYTSQELIGRSWFEVLAPRARYPQVWNAFAQLQAGNLIKTFENPILTKIGSERIINWQNSSISQNGQFLGTISFGIDVTETRKAEQRQAALYRISQAAPQSKNLNQLYYFIHTIISELLPTRNFYIALCDSTKQEISFPYYFDEVDTAEWPPQPLGKGMTAYVLNRGKPILINREKMDELEASGEVEVVGARPVDWLGVPLYIKEQAIGVMAVQSYDPAYRLSSDHLDILQFISNQVAMAIQRKLAEQALAENEERYRLLVDVSPDAIAVHQAGEVIFVNPAAIKLMGAQTAEDLLNKPVISFVAPEQRAEIGQRIRQSLATGTPLPMIEEKFVRLDGSYVDVEVTATPLIFQGKQIMQVMIRDISQRKRQERQIEQANIELSRAYDATLEGWARALELRERETAGHSQRVMELTLQLAEVLDVPQDELEHVRRGALLHDIGKMGIPDKILLKPGPLTEAEWVIMRKHPIFAYEMLKHVPYLLPALDIPYFHHEHWDGSGYPHGLCASDIPLAARLFAVVDVWDALTSERPYRHAWNHRQTMNYLLTQRGKLFDPQVMDAFIPLVENI